MRQNRSMLALAALACLTVVFSLGFFLGRRTVPYEISAQTTRPAATSAVLPPEEAGSDQQAEPAEQNGPVNLNTATTEELETLPRIGPALAQRIVDYRAQYGKFSAPEQLMDVDGIGEATFEGLKDLVTVEDSK